VTVAFTALCTNISTTTTTTTTIETDLPNWMAFDHCSGMWWYGSRSESWPYSAG